MLLGIRPSFHLNVKPIRFANSGISYPKFTHRSLPWHAVFNTSPVERPHSGGMRVVAPGDDVRQELFLARTPDGERLSLVLRHDGSLALLCDGRLIRSVHSSQRQVQGLIDEFLGMADIDTDATI